MITVRTGIILKAISAFIVTALLALTLPALPARADGAASTRNIILGGALAAGTLLILNHNKKVHQKEDELSNARDQAQAQRDQAYASYQSEAASAGALRKQLAAENREMASLKRQIAQQNSQIRQLRKQVSETNGNSAKNSFIGPPPTRAASTPPTMRLAQASYGWGQL
jgi:uncharacterized protein (DUF2252 family)